jgi:hypothetical protein
MSPVREPSSLSGRRGTRAHGSAARHLVAQKIAGAPRGLHDLLDIDAGVDPAAVQQVQQVLGRDVAGGRRGEGAATDAARARVLY